MRAWRRAGTESMLGLSPSSFWVVSRSYSSVAHITTTRCPFGAVTPTRDDGRFGAGWAGDGARQADLSPASCLVGKDSPISRPASRVSVAGTKATLWLHAGPGVCSHRAPQSLFLFCALSGGAWRRETLRGTAARKAPGRGLGRHGVPAPALQCARQAGPGSLCRAAPRMGASLLASSARAAHHGLLASAEPGPRHAARWVPPPETRPDLARAPLSPRKQQSVCAPRAGLREDPPRGTRGPLGSQEAVARAAKAGALDLGRGEGKAGRRGRLRAPDPSSAFRGHPGRGAGRFSAAGQGQRVPQVHGRGALPSPRVLATPLQAGRMPRPRSCASAPGTPGQGVPQPFFIAKETETPIHCPAPQPPQARLRGWVLPDCSRVLGAAGGTAVSTARSLRGSPGNQGCGMGRRSLVLERPACVGGAKSAGRRRPLFPLPWRWASGCAPQTPRPDCTRLWGLRP